MAMGGDTTQGSETGGSSWVSVDTTDRSTWTKEEREKLERTKAKTDQVREEAEEYKRWIAACERTQAGQEVETQRLRKANDSLAQGNSSLRSKNVALAKNRKGLSNPGDH